MITERARAVQTGSPAGQALGALAADLSTERLARGVRDNLAGTLAERVLGVSLFLVLPFLLAPRDLGVVYEVLALFTVATVLATLGLDVGVVRFAALSAEEGTYDRILAHLRVALSVAAGLGLAIGAGVWALAPDLGRAFGSPGFAAAARLGAASIPLMAVAAVLVAPARGLKVMWPGVAAIQVTQPAVQLAATVALVAASFGVRGAVGAYTVSAAATVVIAGLALRRMRFPRPAGRRNGEAGALLRFALPVSGMTLAGTALLWIDTLLLGAYRPPGEVAAYGVVVRLLTIDAAVMLTIIQVFGPFVTQFVARNDRAGLQDTLLVATRWAASIAGPPLVLVIALGTPTLAIFRQHAPGAPLALGILAGGFLTDALTGPVGHVLTMSGRSTLNLVNNVGALVANVALNLALIPRFGIVAAAISWAAVIALLNGLRVWQVHRLLGIHPFGRTLRKPLVAMGIGLAVLVVASWLLGRTHAGLALRWTVPAAAYVAAYLGAMAAQRLEPEDRALVARILGRSKGGPAASYPAGSGAASEANAS